MRASVVVLAMCMLLTGTINTIATKYQDIIVIGTAPDGTPITFRHPAVQSACMFLGESLCLIPYFIMRWRRRKAKRLDPAYVPMPAHEKRSRRWGRIMAFAVPTLCDATGTSLMNIGLFYTYASTYQMLRGTLVLFAGAFTVLILRRQLFIHHWLGMVLITAGAALVGASSVLYQDTPGSSNGVGAWQAWEAVNSTSAGSLHYAPGLSRVASRGMLGLPGMGTAATAATAATASSSSSSADVFLGPRTHPPMTNGGKAWASGVMLGSGPRVWSAAVAEGGPDVAAAPLFGDLLVVGAQMFTALQFILEEKFLVKYKVPALLAVGLEGCWGLVLCAFLLPVTSLVRGPDGVPLDDAVAAFKAIWANAQLGGAVYLSICSIAFFNFFGVSVTKSLSGAARATIDACRTVFIWLYALHAGWESFHALEVVGFVVLISGTSLYNEIIRTCLPGAPDQTSARQSPLPRHSHSRRARSSTRDSATSNGAAADSTLTTPLLGDTSEDSKAAAAAAAGRGRSAAGRVSGAAAAAATTAGVASEAAAAAARAPPVPLRQPAPAHARAAGRAAGRATDESAGASGSWAYHMARSMRLGIHTLSPQSLAATGGLADGEDGEEGSEGDGEGGDSESCSGSYYSSCLASSLGGSVGGSAGDLGALMAGRGSSGDGGRSGGGSSSFKGGGEGGRGSSSGGGAGSSGVRVLRGFDSGTAGSTGAAAAASPGGPRSSDGPGRSSPVAGGPGVGGLSASLAAAAAGGSAAAAGGGGAAAAGGGSSSSSRLRAASPAHGMPPLPQHLPSGGAGGLARTGSSGNVRGQRRQQQPQQQPPQ